jgi:timeless
MYQYGFLLENFQNNGEYINDCIFTMMHHVSGDLSQIAMLFQPHILKTFSKIWDSDYEVCDDWLDLIKYVIYKFTNTTPQQSPLPIPNVLCATIAELTAETQKKVTWTFDEMDTLFWYYAQSKKTSDPLGNVVGLLKKNGDSEKTRKDVLEQLLKQDIIDKEEFQTLSKNVCGAPPKSRTITCVGNANKPVDDVQILVRRLLGDTKGKLLTWLQKVLMECCFVKLRLNAIIEANCPPLRTVVVAEPMTFHSQCKTIRLNNTRNVYLTVLFSFFSYK